MNPLKPMMQSHITFITAASFPDTFGLYVKYSCILSALHCTLRNCRPAISPNSQLLVYTAWKVGQDKILESNLARVGRYQRFDFGQRDFWRANSQAVGRVYFFLRFQHYWLRFYSNITFPLLQAVLPNFHLKMRQEIFKNNKPVSVALTLNS